MSGAAFSNLNGLSLTIKPDPSGVVLRVSMAGALAGLAKTVTVPPEMAVEIAAELVAAARAARDMAP